VELVFLPQLLELRHLELVEAVVPQTVVQTPLAVPVVVELLHTLLTLQLAVLMELLTQEAVVVEVCHPLVQLVDLPEARVL
jgi:hypothetical protein